MIIGRKITNKNIPSMEIKPVREMAIGLTESWSDASLRFLIPSMKEKKNQQVRYVTPKQ